MLTLLSMKEFLEEFPSQTLITLSSKKTKSTSIQNDLSGKKTKFKFIPALDNDSIIFFGAEYPVFVSEKEFLESIKYINKNNINMPFIKFDNNWDFDAMRFARILVKMIESKRRYFLVTDNIKLRMVYKSIVNFEAPIKKTLIIDLHNLFHVRFYASTLEYSKYRNLITVPSNLILSFKNFLHWLIFKTDYDAIYFVTDSKDNWRKKYRTQLLFNYYYNAKQKDEKVFTSKNHKEKEEELIQQIDICEDIIQKLGFPLIKKEGYEADDTIASLAKSLSENFPDALHFIYSNDKDLWQLLEYQNIKIINPKTNEIYDQENDPALKKFGVPYYRVVEYLSLVGDSSDGIPGVKGIGPKKAAAFLNIFPKDRIFMEIFKINKEKLPKDLKKVYDICTKNIHQFILSYQLIFLPRNLFNDEEKLFFYFSIKDTIEFLKEENFEKVFSSFSS